MRAAIIVILVLVLFCITVSLCKIYKDINDTLDSFTTRKEGKIIWLLWFQGWDVAPWLPQQVRKSWELHNADDGWDIRLLSDENLGEYIDSDVLKPTMSMAAKSDMVRLHLLARHGGVWADSTMLCMRPLDDWIYPVLQPCGLFMYHGRDECRSLASWFIISIKNSLIMSEWKAACDEYWAHRETTEDYFWMDGEFNRLLSADQRFQEEWHKVPTICCEDRGQAHMLAGKVMDAPDPEVIDILLSDPPYAIKLSHHGFDEQVESNGKIAIAISLSYKATKRIDQSAFYGSRPFSADEKVVVTSECGDADDVKDYVDMCARFDVRLLVYDKCNFCDHAPPGTYCRPLRNHGRDANTFLLFVTRYYESLPKDIIFVPGNKKHNRLERLEKMLLEDKPETITEDDYDENSNSQDNIGMFQLDEYDGKQLVKSDDRPFKTWYEKYVGLWGTNKPWGAMWNCVMHTTRQRILRHPKEFYERLLESLSGGESLETIHYFERSMRHIF